MIDQNETIWEILNEDALRAIAELETSGHGDGSFLQEARRVIEAGAKRVTVSSVDEGDYSLPIASSEKKADKRK